MPKDSSSYKQIFKATSIYGGVQVFLILISIVRSKLVAILLGPLGIGVMTMFTSTITLLTGFTSFGLGTSTIRDIAEANQKNDEDELHETASIVDRLFWITGLFGALVTLILSPYLSKITFGNYDYSWSFAILSVTLLLGQLTLSKNVFLQGMRRIKFLALSNVIGAAVSLVITIPLYYLYGQNGIVPALIITAFATLAVTQVYYSKLRIKIKRIAFKELFKQGSNMLKLGFILGLSSLMLALFSHLIRLFIAQTGSMVDLGLYNAGFMIVNSYVGMVFTAMSTDYFPRLSAISDNLKEANTVINQQALIGVLILAPILCIFVVGVRWGILILYTNEFLSMDSMLIWAAFGMLFKVASWAISFIFIAKGDSRVFFWNETLANVYLLIFNCAGYYFDGLRGLGISFFFIYAVYLLQVSIVAKRIYGIQLNAEFMRIFIIQLCCFIPCLVMMIVIENSYKYISIIFAIASFAFSFRILDAKLGIANFIRQKLRRV
ncbi:oligosaccharide flippase family protein [Sphingobacterium paludis]|uniref:O-antigen/teichoic acid export membrane protein n=1 Tax=Sphingobacterium paludis TaxID=1476465 RepID=A0A4R7D0E5_9SPHI|nr:oligosaccharide flippase family protein [Sphingobacterium paludis]TDS13692.1 O-antigen/teichoic acid export membrane protein [Sphingobacterium paludis]